MQASRSPFLPHLGQFTYLTDSLVLFAAQMLRHEVQIQYPKLLISLASLLYLSLTVVI